MQIYTRNLVITPFEKVFSSYLENTSAHEVFRN